MSAKKEFTLIPGVDGGPALLTLGKIITVDPILGRDSGSSVTTATIQRAIDRASPGDVILVKPGEYAENLVIPSTKERIAILGAGGRGAVANAPDAGSPLIVHADDVTIQNLGQEAPAAGTAAQIHGRRFRSRRCKYEGGSIALTIGPGTVIDIDAGTTNNGSDALFEDDEFAWSAEGVRLVGSDYGAATQIRLLRCLFHNLTAACLSEAHVAGGANFDHYRDLDVRDCRFQRQEDGTAPAKFIDLNDDNANTGVIAGCDIEHATNAVAVLALSTKLLWLGNRTEAGISAARPA